MGGGVLDDTHKTNILVFKTFLWKSFFVIFYILLRPFVPATKAIQTISFLFKKSIATFSKKVNLNKEKTIIRRQNIGFFTSPTAVRMAQTRLLNIKVCSKHQQNNIIITANSR